jgi:hypothetical protein
MAEATEKSTDRVLFCHEKVPAVYSPKELRPNELIPLRNRNAPDPYRAAGKGGVINCWAGNNADSTINEGIENIKGEYYHAER